MLGMLQAIATIAVETECVSPDKAWCEEGCADVGYTSTDPEWQPCLVECAKKSNATVSAFATALARIDVNTNFDCINDVDPIGDVYVVVQDLLVRLGFLDADCLACVMWLAIIRSCALLVVQGISMRVAVLQLKRIFGTDASVVMFKSCSVKVHRSLLQGTPGDATATPKRRRA